MRVRENASGRTPEAYASYSSQLAYTVPRTGAAYPTGIAPLRLATVSVDVAAAATAAAA